MLYLALALVLLALIFLWQSRRQQKASGLPSGRIVSSDTGTRRELEKPLYDPTLGLTGKPDYLLEQNGVLIPVEVKSSLAPPEPREGHIFQLLAYCILVERLSGKRPPYGLLRYRDRTFAIDYTPQRQEELIDLLAEMRESDRRKEVDRSHEQPARCARCGYRDNCDQKL
jgi:CRISPR-associated exonuclease Cas4